MSKPASISGVINTTSKFRAFVACRRGLFVLMTATALLASATLLRARGAFSPTLEQSATSGGKPESFEVVAIHEVKSGSSATRPVQVSSLHDGLSMKNVSLLAAIQIAYVPSHGAYHYGPKQIVGLPEGLSSLSYDIEAKVSEADLPQWNDLALQPAMLRSMMQAMLADRFKLKVHRSLEVVPIYEMTIKGNRPKFKASRLATLAEIQQEHAGAQVLRTGTIAASGPTPGEQWLFGVTMPALGEFLSTMAGRPIEDRTNLEGKYDLKYQLELPPRSSQDAGSVSDFFSSQILYVVGEQLGLKLKSAMGPMESLVIDHMEPPNEN
jgi:uncharacterized protein (TIGR03435 family)